MPPAPTSPSAPPASPPPGHERRCLNCGQELYGPYCSQCGQEATEPIPRLQDLLQDVYEEFFKVDAKALRTAKSLLWHPGELTAEYAAGRRAAYVAPFKLYFTASFIFFLMMELGGDRDISSWGFTETPGLSPRMMATMEAAAKFYFDNTAIFSILLLPLNGIVLAALFHNRKQPFLLYLVATLHIWSGSVLWFFAPYLLMEVALKIAPTPVLKAFMGPSYLIIIFVYQFIAFRRLFRASTGESVVKSAVLSLWTMFMSTLAFLAIFIGFLFADARKGTDARKDGPTQHGQEQQNSRSGPGRADRR